MMIFLFTKFGICNPSLQGINLVVAVGGAFFLRLSDVGIETKILDHSDAGM